MIERNATAYLIQPETPKTIPNEQLNVYIPLAGYDTPGIIAYNQNHFTINGSQLHLNQEVLNRIEYSLKTIIGSTWDPEDLQWNGEDYENRRLETEAKTLIGGVNHLNRSVGNGVIINPSDGNSTESGLIKLANRNYRQLKITRDELSEFKTNVNSELLYHDDVLERHENNISELEITATETRNIATNANRLSGEAKETAEEAREDASSARKTAEDTHLRVVALDAQVQGIGRSFVIDSFSTFIDFLNSRFSILIAEDRNGDGVNENYDVYVTDLKTGDNILITEQNVPDFWIEQNSALSSDELGSYDYNGNEVSLGIVVGDTVWGRAHVLETDYTVIEGYATSASASAQSARESATSAKKDAATASSAALSAKSSEENAKASEETAVENAAKTEEIVKEYIEDVDDIIGDGTGNGNGNVSGCNCFTDVDALPTENIEKDKIYRVKKETEGGASVVMKGSADTDALDFQDLLAAAYEMQGLSVTVTATYTVVDTLPETGEALVMDTAGGVCVCPIYVLSDTGEPYVYKDTNTPKPLSYTMGFGSYGGLITDKSEATDTTLYYTILTPAESSVTYGIPAPVYQHDGNEWKEMGGGSGGLSLKLIAENLEPSEAKEDGVFFNIGENLDGKTIFVDVALAIGSTLTFQMMCHNTANGTYAGGATIFVPTGVDGDSNLLMAVNYLADSDGYRLVLKGYSMPSGTNFNTTINEGFQPKLTVYSLE